METLRTMRKIEERLALGMRAYFDKLLTYEPVKTSPEEHKKRMEELSQEAKQATIEVREQLKLNLNSFSTHMREIISAIHQF